MLIKSRVLEVEVLPEIGGKIGQIRHRPSGDALLVTPRKTYRTLPPHAPWVDFDTSGMDDCFPCVDEGRYPFEHWHGLALPQMGQWVRGAWTVTGNDETAVALERIGAVPPYVARKQIDFTDDHTMRVRYEVRNTGAAPFHYIWSAHPLISAGENFIVRVPEGPLSFVTFPDEGVTFDWPHYAGVDLSSRWIPEGKNLKVFLLGLRESWCELSTRGRLFRFEFDVRGTPVLGLWFNNYGFAGGGDRPFRCIAVEPCTSPSDVLHTLAPSAYPGLEPGAMAEWWLTLRID